jgi:hypothetical protein
MTAAAAFWFPVTPDRLWAVVGRFDLFESCHRPRLIEAAVRGDLYGRAALRLEDVDDGTRVAVAWSLEMRSAPLRVAARVAYPLLRWGHDRVVDMAVSGFQRRALFGTAAAKGPGSEVRPPPLKP